MVDAIKDIAPAALADSIVSDPVAVPVAMTEPVAAPEVVNAPEAIAAKPKGKPGRPRKVATPAAVAAPIKAPKAKPAPKAEVVPHQAAAQALPVSAPKRAKPAGRKPAKATTPKTTPAKTTAAKSTPAITTPAITTGVAIKARKIATALPRSATPKQKDIFIMTATTTEMTETIQTAMKDAAEKAKAALEKSQAALGDMGAFTKGNMEAVVESSKILATGLQEMGKSYAAETKSVVETMTAEIKDLASVKSPAEFFEKQNAMLRKQFDAAMAVSSKNSEAMLKLASEAFQPISNRVSLAVEKIKHAA
jgi:hypothetical protein